VNIKIKLNGELYWFIGDSLDEDGAIAYLAQCDEDGDIKDWEAALSDSYAHYFLGRGVFRYGKKIANREDILVIK
jgi:hypothetical protein